MGNFASLRFSPLPAGFAACLVLLSSGQVQAQARENSDFALDYFRPGMDRDSVIGIDAASLPPHLAPDAYLWIEYAHNPLVLSRETDGDSERVGALVGRRLTTHLGAALSLFDRVQIGIDVPVILHQGRSSLPTTTEAQLGDLSGFGLGELRLTPKIGVLTAEQFGIDLAFLPILSLPTGVPGDAYLDPSVTFAPTVAISRSLGPLRVAGNMAWRWRKSQRFLDAKIASEVTFGGGAALNIEDLLVVPVELAAAIQGSTPASAPFSDTNATPLELFFSGATDITPELQGFAGLAFGMVAGLGTPDFRIFAGLRYSQRPADRDGDRIPDDVDKCPDEPEDRDDFEDEDGCPDPDNDQDMIPDVDDQCPNQPETPDGIDDEDGCPEESMATLTDDRIEISDKVHFESGSSTIKKMSYPLLNDVAKLIVDSPRVLKIRIEGHTDNVGNAGYNKRLSQSRASAVRTYLIERGVEEHRLEAEGFGLTRPVATNKTPRGRAANRRVEFLMVDVAATDATPEPEDDTATTEPVPPETETETDPATESETEVEFELLPEDGTEPKGENGD